MEIVILISSYLHTFFIEDFISFRFLRPFWLSVTILKHAFDFEYHNSKFHSYQKPLKITNFWKQQMAPSIDRFDIELLFWQINKYIFSITYLFWPNLTQFGPNLDRNSYYLLSNGFKHYMSVFLKIFLVFLVGYFEKIGVEQPRSGDQRNPNSLKITYQKHQKNL